MKSMGICSFFSIKCCTNYSVKCVAPMFYYMSI